MSTTENTAPAAPTWEFHASSEFARFAALWDEINESAGAIPALSAAFIALLLTEFGAKGALLAIGYCGKSAQAMTLLTRKTGGRWETFQPSQAPLGAWVCGPRGTSMSLVPTLLRSLPGLGTAVGITQQDPELYPRPGDEGAVESLDYIQTARVSVSGDFDQYWAARGKNLRSNTKRQLGRLQKDGVATRLETITAPQDVAQAIEDYGRLESAGWKGDSGTAIHPENAQGRFYRALLEDFCRRGAGRIYRYRYGDSVVAIDLCIESRDTLIVLKTTYDETIRDSSPATLLRHEYFRNIFSEGKIRRIEFYGKLMEWHTKWTDEVRTLYHVNFYRWPWLVAARNRLSLLHRTQNAAAPTDSLGQPGGTYQGKIYTDLSTLPGSYAQIFSQAGSASVFSTLPWYRNFVQTIAVPEGSFRIYAVESEGKETAARLVLPMRQRASAGLASCTLDALANYYSPAFGPVMNPGDPDAQKLFDTLAATIVADPLQWAVIDVHPLAQESPAFAGLAAGLQRAGLLVHTYFCFANWFLKVDGRSYADYFQTLPSQLKNTIKRKKRLFEAAGLSRIVLYTDEATLDEGLHAYEQVYAASWKIPEPYPEFIRGLCRTCAQSGWLRLGVVYVEGQPAAAQIWIVAEGIASIYKLAYDEAFAKLSLGSVLTAYLMERVIEVDKVREVDYLTGDDAYKKDWMSDRRERWGIIAFNLHSPRGVFEAARHLSGRAARNALKALRQFLPQRSQGTAAATE